jgi:hypothetical protein
MPRIGMRGHDRMLYPARVNPLAGRLPFCVLAALASLAFLSTQSCVSSATAAKSQSSDRTITICGAVEGAVRSDSAEGVSTLLTLIDSRSGTRFIAEIPSSARSAFEAALGAAPEIAYQGTSVCATGILRDEGTPSMIELSKPEDVKINSRAR